MCIRDRKNARTKYSISFVLNGRSYFFLHFTRDSITYCSDSEHQLPHTNVSFPRYNVHDFYILVTFFALIHLLWQSNSNVRNIVFYLAAIKGIQIALLVHSNVSKMSNLFTARFVNILGIPFPKTLINTVHDEMSGN